MGSREGEEKKQTLASWQRETIFCFVRAVDWRVKSKSRSLTSLEAQYYSKPSPAGTRHSSHSRTPKTTPSPTHPSPTSPTTASTPPHIHQRVSPSSTPPVAPSHRRPGRRRATTEFECGHRGPGACRCFCAHCLHQPGDKIRGFVCLENTMGRF